MGMKARLEKWIAVPNLRNSFLQIPGKAGVADFGSDGAERIITIKCNIYPRLVFSSLVSVLDGIAEWLNPDNGLRQLILDDVPDRYFMARLSDALDCERLVLSAGAFDLNFVCPDPYGYSIADETFDITAAGKSTLTRVKGNTDSLPVYRLKANIPSGNSTYVSIAINGAELKVTGPLGADETLIIDSALMTAKVVDDSGETLRNGLPLLLELSFPVFRKGANEVVISEKDATFSQLSIQAKSRWR